MTSMLTATSERCPCHCGSFPCGGPLGHLGLHVNHQEVEVPILDAAVLYDVAWADEYLPQSAWVERWLRGMGRSGMRWEEA